LLLVQPSQRNVKITLHRTKCPPQNFP
jgi:hypothetical protein